MGGYIGAKTGTLVASASDIRGDISSTDTSPDLTLKNTTQEDTEGGRESTITFKGEQSGGEESTLAEIRASHDGTSDDEKGDLIFKTNDGNDASAPTERLRINSAGDVLVSSPDPSLTITNTTHEDTDGGRESTIVFKGEQSGGELSTLAEIEASHDGTADDEKGDLIFKTNDGSDGASPTERLRIDSAGKVGIGAASSFSTLEVTADKTASNNLQLTLRGSTDTNKQMIMGFDTTDDQSIITSQIAGSAQKPLVINASAVTIPNQPSFAAGVSANNWTTSSATDAPFDVEIFDIGNNYNTSTYTFTAPVAGRYFASIAFNRHTSSRFDIAFNVNGTNRQGAEIRTSHSTDAYKIEDFQTILNLAANDTVKARITGVDSQGSAFFDGNGTYYDVFSMHLLG